MSAPDAASSPAARAPRPARSPPRPWLLLFNCQAPGLANCLTLLSNQIAVEHHDTLTIGDHRDAILAGLDRYDRVLVAPAIEKMFDLPLGDRANVWRLPNLHFGAFHPDICILAQEGPLSTGPLGLYHSAIAYAAFRCGLDVRQAMDLYCARTYSALGYFDRWAADRDSVVAQFARHGFAIGQAFVGWSRRGPFMHTPNRPKIECLLDIAKLVLTRAGLPIADTGHVPIDNLANGPVYPVYPEIAARLGVRGSYGFKLEDRCALLDLEQFVETCFAQYRDCAGIESTWPAFRPVIDNAIRYLETHR
jgi:hypothetical protein